MLISLFSDASMCHDQRVGGWAAWLKSDRGTMRTGAPFEVRVNDTSIAEAMAVVNGMSFGLRFGLIHQGDHVLIQTDNDSVMSILEGTARRKATLSVKNRRGLTWSKLRRDVRERNAEIIAIASIFTHLVGIAELTIRWRHVKGHRGNADSRSAVNTYCDKEAKAHMRTARGRTVPTVSERLSSKTKAELAKLAA